MADQGISMQMYGNTLITPAGGTFGNTVGNQSYFSGPKFTAVYPNDRDGDQGSSVFLAKSVTIGTTPGGGTTVTNYYKMRGYYVAGTVYEVYVVTGAPSSTAPSGHTLTNVTVVATWSI